MSYIPIDILYIILVDIHASQLELKEIFNLRMGRAWETFEGGALRKKGRGVIQFYFS